MKNDGCMKVASLIPEPDLIRNRMDALRAASSRLYAVMDSVGAYVREFESQVNRDGIAIRCQLPPIEHPEDPEFQLVIRFDRTGKNGFGIQAGSIAQDSDDFVEEWTNYHSCRTPVKLAILAAIPDLIDQMAVVATERADQAERALQAVVFPS
jgi:hypothetical protein